MCFSHSTRKRLHLIGSQLNVAFIDGGLRLLQMFDLCVRCRDGWRTCQLASLHQKLILKSAQLQKTHVQNEAISCLFSCVLAKKTRFYNRNFQLVRYRPLCFFTAENRRLKRLKHVFIAAFCQKLVSVSVAFTVCCSVLL